MNSASTSEIDWKTVQYLDRVGLHLPSELARWDVFAWWERERYESMAEELTVGDVLFDVGAEHGWLSVAYGHIVGPENMFLIEPTKEFWPGIRAIWEKNFEIPPRGAYAGLINGITDDRRELVRYDTWPPESEGKVISKGPYQYIHDHKDDVPQIELDVLVARSQVIPDALTIDIEGAEYVALVGARNLLAKYHPKVWVSVHDGMAREQFGVEPGETQKFLFDLGYEGKRLAIDHEEHWYFW